MLTHQLFRHRSLAQIRNYVAARHELLLAPDDVDGICARYTQDPPDRWNDCSLDIWLKLILLRIRPEHFLPETQPPGDIARFLAYIDGNFIFEGYPEEYRRREQEKIDVSQAYVRNPCKDTLQDLQVVFGRRTVPVLPA